MVGKYCVEHVVVGDGVVEGLVNSTGMCCMPQTKPQGWPTAFFSIEKEGMKLYEPV